MCYQCQFEAESTHQVLSHMVSEHLSEKFSYRKKVQQTGTGTLSYRSIHFQINLSEIKKHMTYGMKADIDEQAQRLGSSFSPDVSPIHKKVNMSGCYTHKDANANDNTLCIYLHIKICATN